MDTWRGAVAVGVLGLVACASARARSPASGAIAPPAPAAPAASASAPAAAEPAGASEDAWRRPLVSFPEQSGKLQFSSDGRLLRVVSGKRLAIYDVASRRLVGSHDYATGFDGVDDVYASADDRQVRVVASRSVFVHDGATAALVTSRTYKEDRTIVAKSRDRLIVVDGTDPDGSGTPKGEISSIDLATLEETRLPKAWWNGGTASLTASGDRLAIATAGMTTADAAIYDVAARRRVATVHNGEGGAGAGGLFEGTISEDGKTIEWCHSRAGCTEQSIAGGKPRRVQRFRIRTEKWTIDLPHDMDFLEVEHDSDAAAARAGSTPLTVRDAKGAAVGAIDMPRPPVGFHAQPLVVCPRSDRVVAFAEGQLFVLALPSGKRERVMPVAAAEQADVVCAAGGRHAAVYLGDDVYLVPLDAPVDASSAPPAAPAVRSGTDARKPVLSPADAGFVDPKCTTDKARCGWGWSSRCYDHLMRGSWGWARAACEKGLALAPKDPETRRMLFYNSGRVAEQAGDIAQARAHYTQSLSIREVREVRARLEGLARRGR